MDSPTSEQKLELANEKKGQIGQANAQYATNPARSVPPLTLKDLIQRTVQLPVIYIFNVLK